MGWGRCVLWVHLGHWVIGFLCLGIWSKNRARLRLCPATPGVGTQRVLPTPAVTGQRRAGTREPRMGHAENVRRNSQTGNRWLWRQAFEFEAKDREPLYRGLKSGNKGGAHRGAGADGSRSLPPGPPDFHRDRSWPRLGATLAVGPLASSASGSGAKIGPASAFAPSPPASAPKGATDAGGDGAKAGRDTRTEDGGTLGMCAGIRKLPIDGVCGRYAAFGRLCSRVHAL
ncbi:MAG: hypothetical protein ACI8Y8_003475 [Planctomycetota bacterium]|jgi:hypothetical protein